MFLFCSKILSKNDDQVLIELFVRAIFIVIKYTSSNCNDVLFTKLLCPEDIEGVFRSPSQSATCPSVYQTRWRLHTVPLAATCQAGKL